MKLLLQYQVYYATIIDHRYRVIKALADQGEVFVHAPDRVNGELVPGTRIMMQRIASAPLCKYRLLARKTASGWMGANPYVSQRAAVLALKKGWIPSLTWVKDYPLVHGNRLDALCLRSGVETGVEIKGVNCYYPEMGGYLFPSSTQVKDMAAWQKRIPYKKTVSERCIRQAASLSLDEGVVLFTTIGSENNWHHPLWLNSLDEKFFAMFQPLTMYILRLCWKADGGLYFVEAGPYKASS